MNRSNFIKRRFEFECIRCMFTSSTLHIFHDFIDGTAAGNAPTESARHRRESDFNASSDLIF